MPYIPDLNHSFFNEIDTEEKAYTLGFILADGTISNKREKQRRYRVRIGINERDRDILIKMAKAFEYSGKLYESPCKGYSNGVGVMCGLYISSRGIWKALEKLGYANTPKYAYPAPKWLSEDLKRHFVRGIIDGDGSVNSGSSLRLLIYVGLS